MRAKINIPPCFSVVKVVGRVIIYAEPQHERKMELPDAAFSLLQQYRMVEKYAYIGIDGRMPGGIYMRWGTPTDIVTFFEEQGIEI